MGLKKKNKNREKSRKFFCNFTYFENIDTPNKAYYLGWAITDGNISDSCNQYRIRLKESDIDILEKFRKELESNYKIYHRKNYVEIDITNRKFVDCLINNGCVPNKTEIVKFPNIKKELLWDFVKGIFDGDGSYIFTNKTKKICYSTASEEMKNSLADFLEKEGIKFYIYKSGKCYNFQICSKKSMSIFLYNILSTKSDFLDRKYKKMIMLYEYCK